MDTIDLEYLFKRYLDNRNKRSLDILNMALDVDLCHNLVTKKGISIEWAKKNILKIK